MKENLTIANTVLQARPLPRAYTAENCEDALSYVVAKWQQEHPHGILPVAIANASKMTGTVQCANISPNISCFALTLNPQSCLHQCTTAMAVLKDSKQANWGCEHLLEQQL